MIRKNKGLQDQTAPFGESGSDDQALRDRLKAVIDRHDSKIAAARAAGRSDDQLAKWVNGVQQPGFASVIGLARQVGVSLDWLATGEGEMLEANRAGSDYVLVPRYEVQAAAGAGALVHSEQIVDYLAFKAEWIRRLGRSPTNLLVLAAIGDSMEPEISNGDILLVDRGESEIRDNAIYVLVFGGALVVKRIVRRRDGSVIIKSDNPRYDPETVPPGEVESLRVVGLVFWTGGPV